jgi:hypothetical protein
MNLNLNKWLRVKKEVACKKIWRRTNTALAVDQVDSWTNLSKNSLMRKNICKYYVLSININIIIVLPKKILY